MDINADRKKNSILTETKEKTPAAANAHVSELSTVVTWQVFQQAYERFMEQAEKNAITGKSNGSRTPYGFDSVPICDGAKFRQRFGQGAASATPYMNWWVVSVYYIVESRDIMIGIEEGRYPYLNDMRVKPIRVESVGKRQNRIAVYYSVNKETVNFESLYGVFLALCEEVMRLGLGEA